ncbi:hypothetical protein ACEWY4_009150 [Coilia grayii]|uniref:Uncharacterized protein n=1 Tax=Coilia grayii TaxID=363190 RepID=A0ABD1K5N1_9TELE
MHTPLQLQFSYQQMKLDRKLLKPQVERRRRERINRCLETLSKMLMQDRENQKSPEKAEILEHTVAFLRTNSSCDNKNGDHNNFHSGFSSCMQRASEFLHTTGLATEQLANLSSRLDMVAARNQYHHHHLKSDLHVSLSPPALSKQPSPRSSALKALLSHRWAGDYLVCQISDRTGSIHSSLGKSCVQPPCSPQSPVDPFPQLQPSTDCPDQPSPYACSPVTTHITKEDCRPRQLLPASQPMWRPWP